MQLAKLVADVMSSRFQTWPVGKVQRIGSGFYPDFAFHTCTTQQEVLCTDTFTTASKPPHYSGERWSSRVQEAEAGSKILIPLLCVYSTQTPLLSPQTLLTPWSLCLLRGWRRFLKTFHRRFKLKTFHNIVFKNRAAEGCDVEMIQ